MTAFMFFLESLVTSGLLPARQLNHVRPIPAGIIDYCNLLYKPLRTCIHKSLFVPFGQMHSLCRFTFDITTSPAFPEACKLCI